MAVFVQQQQRQSMTMTMTSWRTHMRGVCAKYCARTAPQMAVPAVVVAGAPWRRRIMSAAVDSPCRPLPHRPVRRQLHPPPQRPQQPQSPARCTPAPPPLPPGACQQATTTCTAPRRRLPVASRQAVVGRTTKPAAPGRVLCSMPSSWQNEGVEAVRPLLMAARIRLWLHPEGHASRLNRRCHRRTGTKPALHRPRPPASAPLRLLETCTWAPPQPRRVHHVQAHTTCRFHPLVRMCPARHLVPPPLHQVLASDTPRPPLAAAN